MRRLDRWRSHRSGWLTSIPAIRFFRYVFWRSHRLRLTGQRGGANGQVALLGPTAWSQTMPTPGTTSRVSRRSISPVAMVSACSPSLRAQTYTTRSALHPIPQAARVAFFRQMLPSISSGIALVVKRLRGFWRKIDHGFASRYVSVGFFCDKRNSRTPFRNGCIRRYASNACFNSHCICLLTAFSRCMPFRSLKNSLISAPSFL